MLTLSVTVRRNYLFYSFSVIRLRNYYLSVATTCRVTGRDYTTTNNNNIYDSNRVVSMNNLVVGDDSSAWRMIGFNFEKENELSFGDLNINFVGKSERRGCLGWNFHRESELFDIASSGEKINNEKSGNRIMFDSNSDNMLHPNGVVGIDHVVIKVNDTKIAEKNLASLGIKKVKETFNSEKNISYSFYRLKGFILEVISSVQTPTGSSSDQLIKSTKTENDDNIYKEMYTNIWGITFVTKDINHTHQYLKELTKPSWPAVQKNRRITTLDSKSVDISLRIAFITPHMRTVT